MTCPKCGSTNILSEQNKSVNVTIKKSSHGFLWWLFLGWIYLVYVALKWMVKGIYWLMFGWWINSIKKAKEKHDAKKVIHICQDCGYRWES